MFKGYKLNKVTFGNDYDHYYQIGLDLYSSYEKTVKESLDSFFFNSNSLDGSEIMKSWFPQVNSHIFLSHSHNDKGDVIALAGWLKSKFNLTSFIDSCIWGYGDKLIQKLDDEYSWLDKTKRIYNYNEVLFSSSHVHMMLSTALSSMIDKTECLIFYDTPNSVKAFSSETRTESPWIYSEIAFSEIVRKRNPKRVNQQLFESRSFSSLAGGDEIKKALKISYQLNYKHLKEIDVKTLNEWAIYSGLHKEEDALDKLYEVTFPITKELIGYGRK